MMKRIDNKGFTLIELLAAIIILAIIMGIALPSISSSMERNKEKQNDSRKKILASYAELYVADHKNAIYNNLGEDTQCIINITTLKDKGYATEQSIKDSDGDEFTGVILFDKSNNSYKYLDEKGSINECLS